MASPRFETAIRTLWAQLRLPPPRLGAQDMVVLAIEGTDIRLSETRDGGGILISASPGRLSPDAMERAGQVGRLLKANLGFLLASPAGVRLDEDGAAVRVELRHAYAGTGEEGLAERVEDVLRRTEFHRLDLGGTGATGTAPARHLAPGDDPGEFILRL